ncbi:solbitol dehydrogenase large subunit [Zymomonas mobilis subsp. mobilis ZM4 = ATCC 31821]|uniref:Glucose-methanol-choline oxidoreductase n=2 Tax=Zymomonas mobilis subsp. mobilis TaxID=120045 RepID=Q5NN01_ZYMMO|nr:GMC family oxidoreductase [Zymomonas mobilis]AAV89909.1 glucose-methanol-choline oxidoreductase [Zymomonas mobilis subsp. mobilis ZM4 = ATCC 31821]AEH61915.1 FAD dependent oxidoreductase [Zymomonas mobilis subsp. mobilis ATCC 10988]AHB09396.1 choline dehydrogenase-like flavoprotein [Zymomonas mobilis subsp. mobilis str. CP4 = NRRL B-14023]AHJ69702.1 Gluconate 2-dehydrogenase flavoprotein precursor [Zymomonas mobilis subsp. mobilis NRRL B-12526]AHJ71558.1 Gluconate 2-dehydrogenase flavoprote
MTSSNDLSADIVIVGSGVAGSSIAKELASTGASVIVLEAGPRIDRQHILDNCRNTVNKNKYDEPYPPSPWSMHPPDQSTPNAYLHTTGPDAQAYQQSYLRILGGTTWHWSACAWRYLPSDFELRSRYGVGRDWALKYDDLEPFYYQAESMMGVCGPDPKVEDLGSPRRQPYPMEALPLSYAAEQFKKLIDNRTAYRVVHEPQARNTRRYDNRPVCEGNNNCMPLCPIGAMYNGIHTVLHAEAAGARFIDNAVVYKIETDTSNKKVTAVHYYDPDKHSHKVTGRIFVIAAHCIESAKLLLLSADEKNPNGIANSSDQVGRNMMDHTGVQVTFMSGLDSLWCGRGPLETNVIDSFRDGSWRNERGAYLVHMVDDNQIDLATALAIDKGYVGKDLEDEIRYGASHLVRLFSHNEGMPDPDNRLTLSKTHKDVLGIPHPEVYYKLPDYTVRSCDHSRKVFREIMGLMKGSDPRWTPGYFPQDHPAGSTIMGHDPKDSVVDGYNRTHDHENLFIASSGVFASMGTGNITLTVAALALRVADTLKKEIYHG